MKETLKSGLSLAGLSPMPVTFFAVAVAPDALPRHAMSDAQRSVLDFWLTAANGAPPSRAMVDPVKLRGVLPYIILWDVLPSAAGYRCRLAGTAICEAAGSELRGMSLEAMHGPGIEVVREEFNWVRDHRGAHFVERTMHWVTKPHRLYKRLLLPLAASNGTVDALLGVITVE